MSNIDWTDAQKKAIETRDTGIVVSAAAGSGKTTVLIERLSQLLLDENKKIPAEKLLAVTFTNKAAAQMREKLNKAIDKEISRCFASPEERVSEKSSWLLEQKDNLQFARVSTINSFCLDFVKDNIERFDFQSGLKILDEANEKMIFENAREQAIEELCQKNADLYGRLCRSFGAHTIKLNGIIRSLYIFFRTIPFREEWITNAKSLYSDEEQINKQISVFRSGTREKLDNMQLLLNALESLTMKISVYPQAASFSKALSSNFDILREQIGDLVGSFEAQDLDRFLSLASPRVRKPSLKSNKMIQAMEIGERSQLEDMATQAADMIAEINSTVKELKDDGVLTDRQIKDNINDVLEVFDILSDLVSRIEEIMYEVKIEKNAVDFSDVEMMTKDLLVEYKNGEIVRTPLCEDIRQSGIYKIITIDEFQDVNDLQEMIFRALSNGKDLSHMGDNVFVVGDIKQAIYRFRQTNPELFSKTVVDANKGYDDLLPVILQENFRSRQGIIDFVNSVFTPIMTEKMGGVDYDDTQKLKFGAQEYPQLPELDGEKCVEMLLVDRHDSFDRSDFSEEYYLIAQKIRKILAPGSGYLVWDKDTKAMRQCRAGDICILMMKNKHITQMSKALEAFGLKTRSQDSEGYIRSSEITLILSILRVIDNPLNDIAMASMLMSPVFGFSASDMLVMHEKRCKNQGRTINGLYTVLSNAHLTYIGKKTEDFEYEPILNDYPDLQKKCSKTYEAIERFIFRSMSSDLERLIRYIYDSTELLSVTSVYLDSEKKRANLLLFLQYARDYEQSGGDGVAGFLRFIDSVYSNDNAFKQSGKITASGDSVNVMTYHASKGLEFPYVFLCDLVYSKNSGSESIYMHHKVSDDPLDVDSFAFETADTIQDMIRTNIYFKDMQDKSVLEDRSEKLRLFYVGCTRAKEKLFLSLSPKCNGNTKAQTGRNNVKSIFKQACECDDADRLEKLVSQCDNMLYWLMCGLSRFCIGKDFARWLNGEYDPENEKASDEAEDFEFQVCDIRKPKINAVLDFLTTDTDEGTLADEITEETEDSALIEKLTGIYEHDKEMKLIFSEQAMLPSKLTVTEIVREENEKRSIKDADASGNEDFVIQINPDFFPSLPKLDDDPRFTAAERGTFTHKFMEVANYPNAQISVKNELQRLVDKGYFTPAEASGVYVNRLEAFFGSDFYKRISLSDEILREKKFLVAMKDTSLAEKYSDITGHDSMLQGIADCVFKEDDGYVVVDYKTDNFRSVNDMDKYKVQLELYKAALEVVLGSNNTDGTVNRATIKSCYIYSFKLGIGKEFKL